MAGNIEMWWFGPCGSQKLWFNFPLLGWADIKAKHSVHTLAHTVCVFGLYLPPPPCLPLCIDCPICLLSVHHRTGEKQRKAVTVHKTSRELFTPFRRGWNCCYCKCWILRTLSPDRHCRRPDFEVREGGKGRKRGARSSAIIQRGCDTDCQKGNWGERAISERIFYLPLEITGCSCHPITKLCPNRGRLNIDVTGQRWARVAGQKS